MCMILIVDVCDSCFPHIINLACQAIVKSITKIQYISDEGDSEFIPMVSTARNFREAVTHDPVAHIRALIRVVCLKLGAITSSSLMNGSVEHLPCAGNSFIPVFWRTRTPIISFFVMLKLGGHQHFSWLSERYCFARCVYCSLSLQSRSWVLEAIDKFVDNEDFTELAKFKLTEADWDALSRFQNILEVCCMFLGPSI